MSSDIVYYCPAVEGGICDYSWEQAKALASLGVRVNYLTPIMQRSVAEGIRCMAVLEDESGPCERPRPVRWLRRAFKIRQNIQRLADFIRAEQSSHVLMASYCEYGSPMWTGLLKRLHEEGVRFGAILHDPVRDYVVGPRWFHEWSVRCGYSYLDEVFVHEDVDRKAALIPDHVRMSIIPHGPFEYAKASVSGKTLRERLGIPADALVLLSFGQIRDGKNLELVLQAIVACPSAWLVVAGKEARGIHKTAGYYMSLAERLDISKRCRWLIQYIEPEDVSSLFEAADLVVLTYSGRFRSASGVLNTAVHFKKRVLASSGNGPLRTQVERYRLGVWVDPDCIDAIRIGLARVLTQEEDPDWEGYMKDNSWRRNAEVVVQRLLNGR